MEKVLIVVMGVEGGGATVYGRRVDGVWSFWHEGTSMYLDENDDDAWRSWTSDPAAELPHALPNQWYMMYPTEVHPDFVEQLRRAYDNCRREEANDGNGMGYQHYHWQEILGRNKAS